MLKTECPHPAAPAHSYIARAIGPMIIEGISNEALHLRDFGSAFERSTPIAIEKNLRPRIVTAVRITPVDFAGVLK
jgi:hypothetical protein